MVALLLLLQNHQNFNLFIDPTDVFEDKTLISRKARGDVTLGNVLLYKIM